MRTAGRGSSRSTSRTTPSTCSRAGSAAPMSRSSRRGSRAPGSATRSSCGRVGRLAGGVLGWRGDEFCAVGADQERGGGGREGPVAAAVVCARGAGADALEAVPPGGRVLVFADAGDLPADVVYRRELTVVGSRSATPASMAEAAALLPELELPEPVVLPLERFAEGLDLFLRREALKVVFVP